MKKKILLIENSITVQKIVSLSLDKISYDLTFSKSLGEAIRYARQHFFDLVLVDENLSELNIHSFPKEVETWYPRSRKKSVVILITSQPHKEFKYYDAVLVKPFTPSDLQSLIRFHLDEFLPQSEEEEEDPKMFKQEKANWKNQQAPTSYQTKPNLPEKIELNAVEQEIKRQDLKALVDEALTRILPPMVEQMVQKRLDELLSSQEAS